MNTDGTIKKDITANMADVPDETDYIDVTPDSVPDNVDSATGEIIDTRTEQEKEDDAILEASM